MTVSLDQLEQEYLKAKERYEAALLAKVALLTSSSAPATKAVAAPTSHKAMSDKEAVAETRRRLLTALATGPDNAISYRVMAERLGISLGRVRAALQEMYDERIVGRIPNGPQPKYYLIGDQEKK